MKIGIDCRLGGVEHAGIGRYIEELVRELTKDTSVHWVLFFQKKNQFSWLSAHKHITCVVAPIRHYTILEQLIMPIFFIRENLDLLHIPHFNIPLLYQGKTVVTIHDLLWHDQRGENMTTLSPLMYALKYRAYRFVSAQAIRRALVVLVPANTIKETVLSHVSGINPDKIYVTPEGVDQKWFQENSMNKHQVTKRPKEKILFYTGSLYPHKNVMFVVQALKQLPDFCLCISSARNVFVDGFLKSVRAVGMGERVKYLGRLSDAELRVWYSKSFALVQPSLSEGFGLTGIEAMASGLPVLASNIAIFQEIYKDAFIPFDPLYSASFVDAVGLLTPSSRKELVASGRKLAASYSWEKMAGATLAVYKNLQKS